MFMKSWKHFMFLLITSNLNLPFNIWQLSTTNRTIQSFTFQIIVFRSVVNIFDVTPETDWMEIMEARRFHKVVVGDNVTKTNGTWTSRYISFSQEFLESYHWKKLRSFLNSRSNIHLFCFKRIKSQNASKVVKLTCNEWFPLHIELKYFKKIFTAKIKIHIFCKDAGIV